MVRKELSLKIMEKIKKLGMRGEITTNFTLFDRNSLEFLIDIGWDRLIVSLDGPNSEINDFLRPPAGTFYKIYNNLKLLKELKEKRKTQRPLVTIQCVLSKINIFAVKEMVDLAAEINAYDLMFEIIKKFSPKCDPLMLDTQDYKKARGVIIKACDEAKVKGVSTNLGSFLDTPELVTHVGKMDEFFIQEYKEEDQKSKFASLPCYEPWSRLFISSIGTCAPCCLATYSQQENIKHKSLLDIWLSETFNTFRNKLLNKEFPPSCKQCNATLIGHSNALRKNLVSVMKKKTEIEKLENINIITGRRDGGSIKLCLISREFPPETDWGGIGRYTYLLAKGLARRGHNVHVITQTFQNEEYEYIENRVYVHRIKHPEIFKVKRPFEEFARRIEYSWRVYRKILELIDKYDIQIVEGPNFSGECFVYSLFKKTPLITRIHTPYIEVIRNFGWKLTPDRKLSCNLEDMLIERSDFITCSTNIYAQIMKKKSGLNSKIKVIPLGIEIPQLESTYYPRDTSKPLNVLFVGRLEKRKGVHVLMEAIPKVIDRLKYVEFTIVGRDTFFQRDETSFKSPERKNFKTEFYEKLPSEIKRKVHLVGEVSKDELENYYKNCDLFVAPSLHETFGFVYLEAMSCGKPVVGCKVGGVPEVIKDGKTGFLVEPSNPDQLAEAIVRILKDPKLRLEIGMESRRYVGERFHLRDMVKKTEKLYEALIKL